MASLRKTAKRAVERVLGITIYSAHPHGRDDCRDIAAAGLPIRTVFDVGANDGGSALKFAEAFPGAVIYSFEPVGPTFRELWSRTADLQRAGRCHVFHLGLGAAAGERPIFLTPHSATSSFVRPADARSEERVPITTVDGFAAEHGIASVDLLKIDTEGFELEVLSGARDLLRRGAVSFVLAEVGFHPGDRRHVLFDDVRSMLLGQGFSVFGVYDQQLEWSGEKRLRFANVCFCRTEAGLPALQRS